MTRFVSILWSSSDNVLYDKKQTTRNFTHKFYKIWHIQ